MIEWGLIFHPLVLIGGYMVLGLLGLAALGLANAIRERILGGWWGS